MEIAFFGHDAGDAAIRRRVVAFADAGHAVTGFMTRRGPDEQRFWRNIDLGQTYDNAYAQRLKAIYQGASIAAQHKDDLRKADLIYARNLDMLLCAMMTRGKLEIETPVVYECLDVHHLLSDQGFLGLALREVERRLLRKTSLLVYSSTAFEREYFAKKFRGLYRPYLLENRLVSGSDLPPRPQIVSSPGDRLKIGWFGILRCVRSLSLLTKLAAQFPDDIEIVIRGKPAKTQIPDFDGAIAPYRNIHFGGAYRAPLDLAGIYAEVDLVWAGDFYQAGYNSKWLLPNRIYEGGYFSTPAIAPASSETGAWISKKEAGYTLPEPLDISLPALIQQLLQNPSVIAERAQNLVNLADDVFIQPEDEMKKLIRAALSPTDSMAAA